MQRTIALLALFAAFGPARAQAQSPINAVAGDQSWIDAHGRAPTAADDARELERIQTHLAWVERRLGRHNDMIESLRLARTLDPRNPRWNGTLINNLIIAHRYDDALAEIQGKIASERNNLPQEARDPVITLSTSEG